MRNLKVLLIAFIATTTVVLGGNAVKKFQENSIRFGRDADQRRIVFDYEEDGTSAIISVDPSDEYLIVPSSWTGTEQPPNWTGVYLQKDLAHILKM